MPSLDFHIEIRCFVSGDFHLEIHLTQNNVFHSGNQEKVFYTVSVWQHTRSKSFVCQVEIKRRYFTVEMKRTYFPVEIKRTYSTVEMKRTYSTVLTLHLTQNLRAKINGKIHGNSGPENIFHRLYFYLAILQFSSKVCPTMLHIHVHSKSSNSAIL